MTGLSIKCPKCRKKMMIRSSQSVTEITTEAFLYCIECGIKAKAFAHLENIEIAEYRVFDLVNDGNQTNTLNKKTA